jgi:4-amino-4-deoxy-L-arabinose transferase-like glycosyltransferase
VLPIRPSLPLFSEKRTIFEIHQQRICMTVRTIALRNDRFLLILSVVTLAAYIAGLFVDVTRDSSKYAAVAREIFESGEYFHLTVHGEPYLQKPPMLFWMGAMSFHIFGLSNFAFKLPVLLLSFFGLYSLCRLGKSLFNTQTGFIAAILLGSSQVYFLYNMDIHTDTVLQSFVTFSLWKLADFLKTGKTIHAFTGFIGIGLAMLTKGPVGAVVPAFAVTGTLIFTGQTRKLADIRWYLGIFFVLLLILPALIGLYDQFGWEGIRFYFWTNNFGRISGSYGGRGSDYFFYFYNLFILFFPWLFLLGASVFLHFGALLKGRFKNHDWFLFSGIWFFFGILTLSRGKLPNYLFILIPLFSLLTARYTFVALAGPGRKLYRIFMKFQSAILVVAALLIAVLVFWFFPVTVIWQWLLLAGLVLGTLFPLLKGKTRFSRLLTPSLAAIVTFNLFLNLHAAPVIFKDQASVKAAEIFNREAAPGDRLFNYNYPSHELFFYSKTPVTQLRNDVTMFKLLNESGNWILTTEEVVNRMPLNEFPKPDVIPLKHIWINKLTFRYLNPYTRQQGYDTLYLLRSKQATPSDGSNING